MVALAAAASMLIWFGPAVFRRVPAGRDSFVLDWHEIGKWDSDPDLSCLEPRYRGVYRRGTVYTPGDIVRASAANLPGGGDFVYYTDGKWYVIQQ